MVDRFELDKQGNVYVLRMRAGENRFNPETLSALHSALDEVEADSGPTALVTTGEGKFYSNGLDLDFMSRDAARAGEVVAGTQRLLARLLTFPLLTVAACNGHAFAAGAMLALAHDYRVMREDRGWFCLPEADIRIPFSAFMDALIRSRLNPPVAHEAMVTARRYTAQEALSAQIAHAAAPEGEVVARAVALAEPHAAKDRATLGAIKRRMYAHVTDLLDAALDPI